MSSRWDNDVGSMFQLVFLALRSWVRKTLLSGIRRKSGPFQLFSAVTKRNYLFQRDGNWHVFCIYVFDLRTKPRRLLLRPAKVSPGCRILLLILSPLSYTVSASFSHLLTVLFLGGRSEMHQHFLEILLKVRELGNTIERVLLGRLKSPSETLSADYEASILEYLAGWCSLGRILVRFKLGSSTDLVGSIDWVFEKIIRIKRKELSLSRKTLGKASNICIPYCEPGNFQISTTNPNNQPQK